VVDWNYVVLSISLSPRLLSESSQARASPRDCGESTMATKKVGLTEELQDRQEALLAGEGVGGSRRSIVVAELQKLFELNFGNGINPLPDLRKSYPAFAWRFIGKKEWSEDLLVGIADESAFVWLLSDSAIVGAKANEESANFANCVIVSSHEDMLAMSRVQFFSRLRAHIR